MTSSEIEVLRAFPDGLSTEEVEVRFGMGTRTVGSHVENVLAKLGVHSKLEAVLLALRAGLVRLEEDEVSLLRDLP